MSTTKAPVTKPAEKPAAPAPAAVATKAPADEAAPETKKKGPKAREFTYIGAGEGSPYVINFMGKQRFTRGKLTEVTDPEVLAKLDNGIHTFVEGQADAETLHQIDEEAKLSGDAKRIAEVEANAKFSKKHRVE